MYRDYNFIQQRVEALRKEDPNGRQSTDDLKRRALREDIEARIEVAESIEDLKDILSDLMEILP